MRGRLAVTLLCALVAGGCAIPGWVPWIGKKAPEPPRVAGDTTRVPKTPPRPAAPRDDSIADRVVAVVNNDAITLAEVLESIAIWRRDNRQPGGPSDDELASQFLNRLIDARVQLHEAEREKITVDEAEVTEELTERLKKLGMTIESLEDSVKAEGLTMESIKKRVRDHLRTERLKRRKIYMRISVTPEEVDRYVDANRLKLETGLSYHARHILLVPEGGSDAAWEAARAKAEAVRAEALGGADFGDLARQHSADPSAKDGGDLGTLKRGELAKDIERWILALETGEISAPYRSTIGWHVFKLEAKESLEGDALNRARQQIHDILFREKYDARHDTWLKEIKQRAIIEVRM